MRSLIVVWLVMLPMLVCAQRWQYGAYLGYALSNTHGQDATLPGFTQRPVSGFAVGGFARYRAAKWRVFSLQADARYLQKGVGFDNDVEEASIRLHYLEVPFYGMLHVRRGKVFQPRLYAGPWFAAALAGTRQRKDKTTGTTETAALKIGTQPTHDMSPWDAGISLGIGADVETGKLCLTFDFQYQVGWLNISPAQYPSIHSQNQSLALLVGLRFPSRK